MNDKWGIYNISNNERVVSHKYDSVTPTLSMGVSGPAVEVNTLDDGVIAVVNYAKSSDSISQYGVINYRTGEEIIKQEYKQMLKSGNYDDQRTFRIVMARLRHTLTYRQLSSNWFYASHGITDKGIFRGPGRCYRSSIVVTGPIRWIHGSPTECPLMNGQNNELAYKYRAYFICHKCECAQKGPLVATSAKQLQSYVGRHNIPKLLWEKDKYRDSDSLYWY